MKLFHHIRTYGFDFFCLIFIFITYQSRDSYLAYVAGLIGWPLLLWIDFLAPIAIIPLFVIYLICLISYLIMHWKKPNLVFILTRILIFICGVFIIPSSLGNFPNWQAQYLHGSQVRIQKHLDIPAIRSWMTELNISREKSSLIIDPKKAPPFIKRLKPWRVDVEEWHDDVGKYLYREVKFQWPSIGVLELNIGPPEMEKPWFANKYTLTLAPGVYLYNLER